MKATVKIFFLNATKVVKINNLNCGYGFGFFMGPKIWSDSDCHPYRLYSTFKS